MMNNIKVLASIILAMVAFVSNTEAGVIDWVRNNLIPFKTVEVVKVVEVRDSSILTIIMCIVIILIVWQVFFNKNK